MFYLQVKHFSTGSRKYRVCQNIYWKKNSKGLFKQKELEPRSVDFIKYPEDLQEPVHFIPKEHCRAVVPNLKVTG